MRVGAHLLQRPEIPDEPLPTRAEQEMEEDKEEEATEHEPEGSSRPKRSRPVDRREAAQGSSDCRWVKTTNGNLCDNGARRISC